MRIGILAGLLAASLLCPVTPAGAGTDPKALEIADRLETAMGGRDRLDTHPYLTFRFVVEREGKVVADWAHAWDRATGRYRLEGKLDGKDFLALFDVDDRQGTIYIAGTPLAAAEAAPRLEYAYGRFINDSYWLLMPWKWRDPGVTLHYEGEQIRDGEPFEVVSLSFESVGLTPKDRYWAFVSKKDGMLERWEFVLQTETGEPGTGDPTCFTWESWEDAGDGLLFSRKRVKMGEGPPFAIRFPMVRVAEAVPDSAFLVPAPASTVPPPKRP